MPHLINEIRMTVGSLREVLLARRAEQPSSAILDAVEIVTRHPSGRPATVLVHGRRDRDVLPRTATPLAVSIDHVLDLLNAHAPIDRVDSIERNTDDWSDAGVRLYVSQAVLEPAGPSNANSGGEVWFAPTGTPAPTSADLTAAGSPWTPIGHAGEDVSFVIEGIDPASWPLPVLGTTATISAEMQLADPEAFHAMLRKLENDQDDATISDADRAVDAVDLDRLSAELRLMLPEFSDVAHFVKPPRDLGRVDYGTDYEQGRPDGYSAEAIVAWFREEVAAARRRAYRTGVAYGRAAAQHQEPTA